MSTKKSVYFSVDIEADGPIPGRYSMLSIGASLVGHHDATRFHPVMDTTADTFYRELRPISDEFVPEALEVCKLDRDALLAHGSDPATAMADFTTWIEHHSPGARAVFVGYPAGYDWMFAYWYLINFTGASPFGHSRMLDMKSFYAGQTGRPLAGIVKNTMPRRLMSNRPHTHRADDDAAEQGDMFINLMAEAAPTASPVTT